MSENGLYDDRVDKILGMLMEAEKQTKELKDHAVTALQSIAMDCRSTAQHTSATAVTNAAIAITLDKLQDNNKQQVQIIAGKWQVPMPVFLVIVLIFAVWMVTEKAAQTGTQVKISPNNFEITQQDHEGRNGKTDPKEATRH